MYVERLICMNVMCCCNHAAYHAYKTHKSARTQRNEVTVSSSCLGLIRDLRTLRNPTMQRMGESCLIRLRHQVLDRLTCAFVGSLAFRFTRADRQDLQICSFMCGRPCLRWLSEHMASRLPGQSCWGVGRFNRGVAAGSNVQS